MLAASWSHRHQEFLHVWIPVLAGVAFLVVVFVLYRLWQKSWNVFALAEGADLRPSTSKLQVLLWTIVVIFGYVVVETARFIRGNFDPLDQIPANVLIALGFTIGTATLAKGITTTYVASGRINKDADPNAGAGSVVADDQGAPDLSKAQLLAWTLIALIVYIVRVFFQLRVQRWPELPDIDTPLMVLMGLGQGAYIGKKLVTTTTPRLGDVSPAQGPPGTQVTISGVALAGKDEATRIRLDDVSLPAPADRSDWDDDHVIFTVPPQDPKGQAWTPPQKVKVSIVAGGQTSANSLEFTVTSS